MSRMKKAKQKIEAQETARYRKSHKSKRKSIQKLPMIPKPTLKSASTQED